MVTHSSTSGPVQCLCMVERTGCLIVNPKSLVLVYKFEYRPDHTVNVYDCLHSRYHGHCC